MSEQAFTASDGPREEESAPAKIAHAALRGAIAAMAMTGMRTFTQSSGLLEEAPPRSIIRQKTHGLIRLVPRARRSAAIELMHLGYGAVGGAGFGLLPEKVRMRGWSGPLYGLVTWLGFELGLAPALGLSQSRRLRPMDRLMLAADHLLYGLVLSETRRRPRE